MSGCLAVAGLSPFRWQLLNIFRADDRCVHQLRKRDLDGVHIEFHFSLPILVVSFAGLSIECYQCNSAYDPRCGDPFDNYSLGQVNCSMKPPLEHLTELVPTMCRKIIQKGILLFCSQLQLRSLA
jgi:hypothetical protein